MTGGDSELISSYPGYSIISGLVIDYLLHITASWFCRSTYIDIYRLPVNLLTSSSLQTSSDSYAYSADPDETAGNEPSQLDLPCLPFCLCFFFFGRFLICPLK